jgi:hypothetical protein
MTRKNRNRSVRAANTGAGDPVPPGATRRALDREDNGGGPPGSPLGDPHAAGTPAGGTETGGLAGSNVADGSPLAEGEDLRREGFEEKGPPYAGPSGGAVGGTPAEGRASGDVIPGAVNHDLFSPGTGSTRGDTTIGADPTPKRGKGKRKK